ncbi:MAG: NAD(P)-dependent oxidoreductase, partial [Lentisphaerota bacterium]
VLRRRVAENAPYLRHFEIVSVKSQGKEADRNTRSGEAACVQIKRLGEREGRMSKSNKKSVVFTGSAGFLGRGIFRAFEKDFHLRLVDVFDFEARHEKMIGDVADPEFCLRALSGMDYLVIAHMYPRKLGYENPYGSYNANVTGTANLLYAAHENGIKRVCLISSEAAVSGRPDGVPHTPETRPAANDVYSATKACQEITAEAFHRQFGLEIAIMRLGYVVDLNENIDKYGTRVTDCKEPIIDPADCGNAVRSALELPKLSCRVFYVYSLCTASNGAEGFATYRDLNWQPRFSNTIFES